MTFHHLLKALTTDLTPFRSLQPTQRKTLIQWIIQHPQHLNALTDAKTRDPTPLCGIQNFLNC